MAELRGGSVGVVDYLANDLGPLDFVIDVSITRERTGDSRDPFRSCPPLPEPQVDFILRPCAFRAKQDRWKVDFAK